jgi:hypothetical protein
MLLLVASCKKEDVPAGDFQKLGSSARGLLSDERYQSLEVEISFMPGYQPNDTIINHVTNYLNTYIRKPGGIRFYTKLINNTVTSPISLNGVVALEKEVRTNFTRSQTIAIHILIVDAEYQSGNILGISYWNTSMCMFGKTIAKFSGKPGQVTKTQLTITLIEHEMGHLLGLVDQGSPMLNTHIDTGNGAHCKNGVCLMNYLIETSDNGSGFIPGLDRDCQADLRGNGGK